MFTPVEYFIRDLLASQRHLRSVCRLELDRTRHQNSCECMHGGKTATMILNFPGVHQPFNRAMKSNFGFGSVQPISVLLEKLRESA